MILDTTSAFRGKDLTGMRFNRHTVVRYAGKNYLHDAYWECRCDCGTVKNISGHTLTQGTSKSCGCYKVEKSGTLAGKYLTTHGYTIGGSHPEYYIFLSMRARCFNSKNHKFAAYGGRGITVCERWHNSFENFIADMGDRLSPKHTLGRINNDGNYEPSNCRWETRKQQARNRRDNHFIEFNGRRATLVEWSEITQLPYHTVKKRLNNYHWSVEDALTKPVKKHKLYAKTKRP